MPLNPEKQMAFYFPHFLLVPATVRILQEAMGVQEAEFNRLPAHEVPKRTGTEGADATHSPAHIPFFFLVNFPETPPP